MADGAFDPWIAFTRDRAGRAVRTAARLGRGDRRLALHVLSGLHAGTRIQADGTLVVGGAPDDDLLLLDDVFDGRALILRHRPSPLGGFVQIEARNGETSAVEGAGAANALTVDARPLDADLHRLPCRLCIGEVELALSEVAATAAGHPARRSPALGLGLLGLAVLGGGVGVAAIGASDRPGLTRSLVMTAAVTPDAPGAPVVDAAAGRARAWLSDRIATDGLSDEIALAPGGAPLRVSGTLAPADHRRWVALHRAFDDRFPDAALIARVALRPARPDLPPIAAARLAPAPQLILADGRRIAPGDTIAPGWIVEAIDPAGIELRRGVETLLVEF